MMKRFRLFVLLLSLGFIFLTIGGGYDPGNATAQKACPWKITGVEAGKWANGNKKAGIWIEGSFPSAGLSERPNWYINGVNCGRSQIFFRMRFLPNSSHLLKDKSYNTVKVQFYKPPYNGTSDEMSFYFDWSEIPPGGHKMFR